MHLYFCIHDFECACKRGRERERERERERVQYVVSSTGKSTGMFSIRQTYTVVGAYSRASRTNSLTEQQITCIDFSRRNSAPWTMASACEPVTKVMESLTPFFYTFNMEKMSIFKQHDMFCFANFMLIKLAGRS